MVCQYVCLLLSLPLFHPQLVKAEGHPHGAWDLLEVSEPEQEVVPLLRHSELFM